MSGMPYPDFLNAVIDDGQSDVRQRFSKPNQHFRRDGAIEGFEACRGKDAPALVALLASANERAQRAYRERAIDYWFWRERAGQIKWVLGVVSAAFLGNNIPPPAPVSHRQYLKAMAIFGHDGEAVAPGK